MPHIVTLNWWNWPDGLCYDVHRVSDKRAFWAVFDGSKGEELQDKVMASGYTVTVEEAERAAWAQLPSEPYYRIKKTAASYHLSQSVRARCEQRQRNVEKRMAKDTASDAAAPLEFLYQDIYNRHTTGWYSHRHRIVKRTAKRVFVERKSYEFTERRSERIANGAATWYDHDVETYSLDRHDLETKGEACTGSGWARECFYTTPYEARHKPTADSATSDALAVLGLSWPSTKGDVQRSYRRMAKKLHPDHGGDAEAFRKASAAYGRLMSTLSN